MSVRNSRLFLQGILTEARRYLTTAVWFKVWQYKLWKHKKGSYFKKCSEGAKATFCLSRLQNLKCTFAPKLFSITNQVWSVCQARICVLGPKRKKKKANYSHHSSHKLCVFFNMSSLVCLAGKNIMLLDNIKQMISLQF